MWPGPYGDYGSRKYLLASLDQSLKRMGLDYVDIFYSHRRDPETPLEETLGALDTAVRQGKALYAGISSYSAGGDRRGGRDAARRWARRSSSTSRPTRCSTAGSSRACSTCSSDEGVGCIVVLAARAGHADRPLPGRHPRGLAREPRRLALARAADGAGARRRSARSTSIARRRAARRSRRWRSPGRCATARVTSTLIGASQRRAARDQRRRARPPRLQHGRARRDRPPRDRERHQHLGRVERRMSDPACTRRSATCSASACRSCWRAWPTARARPSSSRP